MNVRSQSEYDVEHLENAILIHGADLDLRTDELAPKNDFRNNRLLFDRTKNRQLILILIDC